MCDQAIGHVAGTLPGHPPSGRSEARHCLVPGTPCTSITQPRPLPESSNYRESSFPSVRFDRLRDRHRKRADLVVGLVTGLNAGALGAAGVAESRFRLALLIMGSVLTGLLAMPHGSSSVVSSPSRLKKSNYRESSFPSVRFDTLRYRLPGSRCGGLN